MGIEGSVRSKRFGGHSSILNISGQFFDFVDHNTLCLVLPLDVEVSPIRSLMRSSPKYQSIGLVEDCIAIAVRQTLIGLSEIHEMAIFTSKFLPKTFSLIIRTNLLNWHLWVPFISTLNYKG